VLFNSWSFLILLVLTFALYHVPVPGLRRKNWQVGLLLAASAVFYAWEEPRLLILLSASCLLNAIAVERILFWKKRMMFDDECLILDETSGRKRKDLIENSKFKIQNSESKARQWLWITVALNLAFLAFFKYAGFFAEQLPHGWLPVEMVVWLRDIPLPVGISFYTFQGISLVVDVWRNDISEKTAHSLAGRGKERIRSIRDTSFYVAFFPQLVAGPIVKAHEFVDQIGAKYFKDIDWTTVRRGLVLGYFLKVFVADNLAEQTGVLTLGAENLSATGSINLMSLLYGYSLQIFADFAGYSLIAIGLGALFGYNLPSNFNFPYLSTSITEFWRRWHLSLSSWLRDYLYIPLGGNRKGSGRTYFNLFLVMFLGGLWHGAAWKFALWGSLHGMALAAERLALRRRLKVARCRLQVGVETNHEEISQTKPTTVSKRISCWHVIMQLATRILQLSQTALAWFLTFHLVTALWLTFMMPDMANIWAFFQGVFSGRTGFSGPPIFSLFFYGTAVVLYHAWGWLREHKETLANRLMSSPLEPMAHGVMLFLVLTNPGAPRGFIYFQF
jgi:alginate O-acetyltransferase complex protein AlgI